MRAAVLALIALAGAAEAMPASRCPGDVWRVEAGSLSPGAACQRFVVTTDLRARGGSSARLEHRTHAGDGDIALALTVRALTAGAITIELQLPGGYLLLRDGELGVYTSEVEWAARGWQPFPPALVGHALGDGIAIAIAIHGTALTVSLDGVAAGTYPLAKRPATQAIVLAVTGQAARRARVLVSGTSLVQAAMGSDAPARPAASPRAGAPPSRAP